MNIANAAGSATTTAVSENVTVFGVVVPAYIVIEPPVLVENGRSPDDRRRTKRTSRFARLQTLTTLMHPVWMAALHKVTYDPESGRPIAPIWWRLTSFYVAYGWLAAGMLTWLAYIGVRDGQSDLSAVSFGAAGIIILYVHWERHRVQRKRRRFEERIAAYERVLSKPV